MSIEKIKILHLVDSSGGYGIEKMLMNLLVELKKHGHYPVLANLNTNEIINSEFGNFLSSEEIKFVHPNASDKSEAKTLLFTLRLLKRIRPSIVNTHGYKATIIGGIISKILGFPCVATYHAEAKHATNVKKYIKLETYILRLLKGVVAVSHPIMEELNKRKVRKTRIKIINNGINGFYSSKENLNDNGESDEKKLLYVGRLIQKKNVHILIDVFSALKKKFSGIALIIAGNGPYKQLLIEQVERLGISESVKFLGYVENLHAIYSQCHCFVLPSQTEGMPISLLEAMSASLPIIVTPVGSIPDVVADGAEALFVKTNDANSLYQQLMYLLYNPSVGELLGKNARLKFLQKYTSQIMAENYIEFYKNVLNSQYPL